MSVGSGAAPPDLDVAAARSGAGRPGTSAARRLHATVALARIEASLLTRSLLVLGGLVAGAVVVWFRLQWVHPLWWNAAWQFGYGQMLLSATVLVAAQLAAGRARRNNLADLYASFPASAGARTRAQLLATLGALPAGVLLAGGLSAAVALRGGIGIPSAAVLIGGLLLVLAGGCIGVAVGTRFPHPLAGVLAALLWFAPFSQSNRFTGGFTWLYPWVIPDQLGQLPAPLAGYPPAAAHALELAGIVAVAGALALAVSTRGTWPRARQLIAAVLAAAVVCVAGAVQLQPVPTADLARLVDQAADPTAPQQCTATGGVRYCLYPGFGAQLPAFRAPVDGVLAQVPTRPAHPLTVRQALTLSVDDTTLTHGHTQQEIGTWAARLRTAPDRAPVPSTIYLTVGSWPAGSRLPIARFDLALAAAEWAVHLPVTSGTLEAGSQCLPLDQAREAIAIWLAIRAAPPSTSALRAGLPGPGGQGSFARVAGSADAVPTWTYPGEGFGYLTYPGPQTTVAGYDLAEAMTALPAEHVQQVIDRAWARWLDPHTSDADLAAALGVPAPTVPSAPLPRAGVRVSGSPPPPQPVCGT